MRLFAFGALALSLLARPLNAHAEEKLNSLGTGFYISPHQVLTNSHVIRNCLYFMAAHQDEEWFPATLLYNDPSIDLALISTAPASPHYAAFESAPDTVDAKDLAVVGFPNLGRASIRPVRYSVSATSEGLQTDGNAVTILGEFHPGNSGSPVLDRNGTVVGIIARGFDTVVGYQRAGKLIDDGGEAVSNAAIYRFLNLHHVSFDKRGNSSVMSVDDQFDAAKSIVVQIGCWN